MKKLDKDILKTLRDYYLLSVRGMALSVEEGPEYRRAAAQTSCTVFTLFGHAAAETLRKDGLREWTKIRAEAWCSPPFCPYSGHTTTSLLSAAQARRNWNLSAKEWFRNSRQSSVWKRAGTAR